MITVEPFVMLNTFHPRKMNEEFEPVIKYGGTAFNGNNMQGNRPQSHLIEIVDEEKIRQTTKVVSLVEFCDRNFITRYQGYQAIKKGLLIGFRKYGKWWVRSNPQCQDLLLDYLNLEILEFDVEP